MAVGELCIRQVVVASRDTRILDGAKLMRQHHVGDIIVIDESAGRRIPAGIVTDRDLVIEVMAMELDAGTLTLCDIMSADLITVREDEGVFQTIQLMRAKGVRRAPVVDGEGGLVGIVSVDDLLELLAEELSELAKLIAREQRREAESRQ